MEIGVADRGLSVPVVGAATIGADHSTGYTKPLYAAPIVMYSEHAVSTCPFVSLQIMIVLIPCIPAGLSF